MVSRREEQRLTSDLHFKYITMSTRVIKINPSITTQFSRVHNLSHPEYFIIKTFINFMLDNAKNFNQMVGLRTAFQLHRARDE